MSHHGGSVAGFRRCIVLDATSTAGCYAVEALLDSPFAPAEIVAAAWQATAPSIAPETTHINSMAAALAMLEMMQQQPVPVPKAASPAGPHQASGAPTRAKSLRILKAAKELTHVDAATDLLVYVTTTTVDTGLLQEVATRVTPASAAPTLLLLTSNDAHRTAAVALADSLKAWRIALVKTITLAPPTTARPRPAGPAAHVELISALETFTLGVALGVTRFFQVNASQPADLVPMDVALHTGIAAITLHLESKFPASTANPNHLVLGVLPHADTGVVWGMVAEYVLDYYGRFGDAIAKSVPGGAFHNDPTVAFNAHFPDLWNYGLALTTPIEFYRQMTASRTKNQLVRTPHSTTAERMNGALRDIDSSLDVVIRQTPHSRQRMDNTTYLMLLRRLGVSREHASLFRAAALSCVKWEMYVKRIAVRVLHYLSVVLLNNDAVPQLPQPLPVYHNDLFFQGIERAPDPNLVLRRWMDDVHMVLRSGQQPNGLPVVLTPGGTTRTFLGILAQPHVQRLITQLADEQYLPREDVETRAVKILRQIGDTQNHTNARTLAYAMRKIFKTLYTRVTVNDAAFDTLFRVFNTPRTAVVMMPSHRSYMDFIVLSYMLLVMGFPIPHICSGEDFLSLGKISELLRGSGAFFMRRSFKNDKLYGALFKEYVRNLVRRGQCIEFFIEGTRSRTQKTMSPKVGLLKIVTDSFLEPQQEINDVVFLPIALSYEKILEGNVYADELLGIPKPKETTMNLLKSASVLREKFGSFNVSVGQPISLAEFSSDPDQVPAGFRRKKPSAAATGPNGKSAAAVGRPPSNPPSEGGSDRGFGNALPSYTPSSVLTRLAWRITHELQRNLVVTPTALIAAVVLHMFDHTELREVGVPMAAVASNVEWLRSLVLRSGGQMNHEYAAFDGLSLLRYAVRHLNPHLTITAMSRVVMSSVSIATYMLLGMYANQLVHLFGDEGTLLVAANSIAAGDANSSGGTVKKSTALTADSLRKLSGQAPPPPPVTPATPTSVGGDDEPMVYGNVPPFHVSRAALYRHTSVIRSLMSYELPDFASSNPTDPAHAFDACLARMTVAKAAMDSAASVQINPNTYTGFVAQLVYPCIESYFVIHVALSVLRTAVRVPEAVLLTLAHKLALQLYDRKLVQYVQSSNKETLKNALTRAIESNTAVFDRAGRTASIALPPLSSGVVAGAKGAADTLADRTRDINWMRNRPLSPEELATCCAVALQMFAATSKLPSKL